MIHVTPTASKPFAESILAFRSTHAAAAPAGPTEGEVDAAIADDTQLSGAQLDFLALALELADEAARADIESEAPIAKSLGQDWCDLNGPPARFTKDDAATCAYLLSRAARYFELRPETPAFRVVRHPAFPNLVRFEAKDRVCRGCGCTDHQACEGGCSWVGDTDLCTACQEKGQC